MKIAIIGAGFSGLTAGFYLSRKGHQVTIFEKSSTVGGLAASFKKRGWQWPLEFYPHHLFTSDHQAIKLINKLGLSDQLFFIRPKTSIFLKEKIFQFDSPASILFSPVFSLPQKIRIGLVTAYLRSLSNWKSLEKTTAINWSKRFYGQKATQFLWGPLLRGKFSKQADQVAMSWFWTRIKKRSPKLGYLQGGFQTLLNKLTEEIKKNKGEIIYNSEIKKLEPIRKNYDQTIVAAPVSAFLKLAPKLTLKEKGRLQKLKMIGAACLVLVLKNKFLKDNTYWLNINEAQFPFVFVDEHTNFASPRHYGGNRLLYVGGYYPQNHRYFKMEKAQVLKEFLPYLKKINPDFNFSASLLSSEFHTDLNAQPVIPINYSRILPPHQTSLSKVYLANLHQIYPWDRGINYSIELGEKIANLVLGQ
jgi:protoporphyrinogen oxidase